jgi:hypothetical protein
MTDEPSEQSESGWAELSPLGGVSSETQYVLYYSNYPTTFLPPDASGMTRNPIRLGIVDKMT